MIFEDGEISKMWDLLSLNTNSFILDLRTTRHHINAIESGDLRIFYGAPFYIDLMRRYAKLLSFSDDEMVWVTKADQTVTPDDVLELAKELYQFMQDNQNSQGQENQENFSDYQ